MTEFEHQRHKPPTKLERPREMVLVCAPLRSNVNLSRIVRAAACCGVPKLIACGNPKIDRDIARDAVDHIEISIHRSLPPVLKELRQTGHRLVGLEQTTHSMNLPDYAFERKTALVIGNERLGLTEETLTLLDDVVEIPVFGMPYSYNVATATAMALYEFCRQYPTG
ncbi:MAG: RNA methyltransferase [Planctomycetaceae bacterium]|nr:RNA methyltransferase [Planctomycetaceae bacterium]